MKWTIYRQVKPTPIGEGWYEARLVPVGTVEGTAEQAMSVGKGLTTHPVIESHGSLN